MRQLQAAHDGAGIRLGNVPVQICTSGSRSNIHQRANTLTMGQVYASAMFRCMARQWAGEMRPGGSSADAAAMAAAASLLQLCRLLHVKDTEGYQTSQTCRRRTRLYSTTDDVAGA